MAKTKRVVSEKIAVAQAKLAADEMFSATTNSCPLAFDVALIAAQRYGTAAARLGDDHPALRASYKSMSESFRKLVERCTKR